ncbi:MULTISPECIES: hypothetical protein [Leclercia]|uniref:hypothetical protein n=1 Tax=Leclercia TaxID=83654 RepID=UPI001E33C2C4|nr:MULTISPECIES: hypothetical protein [Leclercia]MCE9980700.1 hypothetical protein [Leclercia adecarboxylata]UGB02244.1 hypothetical protein LRS40_21785 [Leclercia sp. G3L]
MEIIGLLLLAWLGYVIFGGYNKAKTRRYHAVVARAKRTIDETNELYRPTWINNDNKRNEFIDVVRSLSSKQGVPGNYLDHLFNNEAFNRMVLMKFTAILEQNKLSFTDQKNAVSELIRDLWKDGVEMPPSNSNLQQIVSFLDTKIFNSFDASAVAARLYLDANFIHAVETFNNPSAVSFEEKYGHTISSEAKEFFDKIEVTNGAQYMELNYQSHGVNLTEISRYISSFSNNKSSEELILKLLTAEHLIETWKLR